MDRTRVWLAVLVPARGARGGAPAATLRCIVLLAVLVFAFTLAGCGGDDEASPTTTTETEMETTGQTETETTPPTMTEEEDAPVVVRITVRGGVPSGGIVRKTVTKGDRVRLVVVSDVADEIHLHGYDLSRDVEAGGTAQIAFRATLPGRFEVELEERGVQIADLTVEP